MLQAICSLHLAEERKSLPLGQASQSWPEELCRRLPATVNSFLPFPRLRTLQPVSPKKLFQNSCLAAAERFAFAISDCAHAQANGPNLKTASLGTGHGFRKYRSARSIVKILNWNSAHRIS
jgi:hypothetical protein